MRFLSTTPWQQSKLRLHKNNNNKETPQEGVNPPYRDTITLQGSKETFLSLHYRSTEREDEHRGRQCGAINSETRQSSAIAFVDTNYR